MITFDVLGNPAPKGSKRHVGRGIMIESSKAVLPWLEAIKAVITVQQIPRTDGPVFIACTFRFARPKSHYRTNGLVKPSADPHPTGRNRGDLDKLERSVFDGLTQAGAIEDDAYVVASYPAKRWCRPGESPGATISIAPMAPNN